MAERMRLCKGRQTDDVQRLLTGWRAQWTGSHRPRQGNRPHEHSTPHLVLRSTPTRRLCGQGACRCCNLAARETQLCLRIFGAQPAHAAQLHRCVRAELARGAERWNESDALPSGEFRAIRGPQRATEGWAAPCREVSRDSLENRKITCSLGPFCVRHATCDTELEHRNSQLHQQAEEQPATWPHAHASALAGESVRAR